MTLRHLLSRTFLLGSLLPNLLHANPEDWLSTEFADASLTPSPACLCASAAGEVFVGVDLNGSLGKGPDKGRIVRLLDMDNDGTADSHTIFARVDNPRGLVAMGNRLWVLHSVIPEGAKEVASVQLSVFEDLDGDGIADGPPQPLVKNISTLEPNRERGADHTTNGIQLGIDGWIYIAVGDFGFVEAEGRDGRKLTLLGGGILRVRPDGTEMEMYTRGLRNIYDVAIDPFMNIFTRGNTNDGGGWNIRFIHHVQSGDYGYPTLFKHFTPEILPALADLGGGSGAGALFLQEPSWPARFNNLPLMADWGRSQLYIHRVEPDGPSFTQKQEPFLKCSQISDVDVDASGRLYLASWNGAGYKGNPDIGLLTRVVPSGWQYVPFPNLKKAAASELLKLLASPSAKTRLSASQEILLRRDPALSGSLFALASNEAALLEARVAALFTLAQLGHQERTAQLTALAADASVREWALRALADRHATAKDAPRDLFTAALQDPNPRVQVAAAIGLGRMGDPSVANALLAVTTPGGDTITPFSEARLQELTSAPNPETEGPHAKPNPAIILPHVAVHSLRQLEATQACLEALSTPARNGALWALQQMHSEETVTGLLNYYQSTDEAADEVRIIAALARLSQNEAPYDGSWWWKTQPDTRGPYYVPSPWSGTEKIARFVQGIYENAPPQGKDLIRHLADRNRSRWEGIGGMEPSSEKASEKGEIGRTSIEDIVLALDKLKGRPNRGKTILKGMACAGCHNLTAEETIKGPDLSRLGSQTPAEIAESIIKPSAIIASSWVNITRQDGTVLAGTIVEKNDKEIVLHDIAGTPTRIPLSDIQSTTPGPPLMGPHLADELSLQQFADVIAYLRSLDTSANH
ncbi:DUF7133 domain-containing protein [Roseibacillus ishigakijimensis]|uniref:HEAT repeat domain-containing protein n=1 Tax=Roseibacillus ishigakijimensis TaxID=454146 RepID=A0A934VL67_9BACT|nr:HEAT repeat domain-containing protein [Roseibacillus ishigakijimensis]MBK1834364.1 HEAT repeat domain-containing protein [Roseibacillus ishigakijimensis]